MAAAPPDFQLDRDGTEPVPLSVPTVLGFEDSRPSDPRETWLQDHGWRTVGDGSAWAHERAPGVTFTLAEATGNQMAAERT